MGGYKHSPDSQKPRLPSTGGFSLGPGEHRDLNLGDLDNDVKRAIYLANPYYATSELYTINCQSCIWAFEANMRGEELRAKAYNSRNLGDLKYGSGIRSVVGGKWENTDDTERGIINRTKRWGKNARGILELKWKGKNSGHVINIVRKNGHTRFIDAQTGTDLGATFSEWVKHKGYDFKVMRVDNKPLDSSKFSKMTTKAKRIRDKNPYFVEWGEEV